MGRIPPPPFRWGGGLLSFSFPLSSVEERGKYELKGGETSISQWSGRETHEWGGGRVPTFVGPLPSGINYWKEIRLFCLLICIEKSDVALTNYSITVFFTKYFNTSGVPEKCNSFNWWYNSCILLSANWVVIIDEKKNSLILSGYYLGRSTLTQPVL